MHVVNRVSDFVSKYLIVIMVILMVVAHYVRAPFAWVPANTTILLSMVMFCMGMTLDLNSFRMVAKNPKAVLLGLLLQFTLSPLFAWLLAIVSGMDTGLIIGFVLLGAVPGGTASNVMTFLAGGDVALTVSMTTLATLLATFVTPALTWMFAGQYTSIAFWGMLVSVVKMVLVPVVGGVVLNKVFTTWIPKLKKTFVLISSLSILLIVAGTVSKNADNMLRSGLIILLLVIVHNALGYLSGYFVARKIGLDHRQAISVCFQTGMKNTGLAITLGNAHFPTIPQAVVPAAVGMVVHQITGPLLAGYINRKDQKS